MTQRQMTIEYNLSPNKQFESKLISLDDWKTCLVACCLPCIIYGKNQERALNKEDYWYDAAIYCIAGACGFYSCIGAKGRGNVRTIRAIEGGFAKDCITHFCCAPCALTQEKLELDKAMGKQQ